MTAPLKSELPGCECAAQGHTAQRIARHYALGIEARRKGTSEGQVWCPMLREAWNRGYAEGQTS